MPELTRLINASSEGNWIFWHPLSWIDEFFQFLPWTTEGAGSSKEFAVPLLILLTFPLRSFPPECLPPVTPLLKDPLPMAEIGGTPSTNLKSPDDNNYMHCNNRKINIIRNAYSDTYKSMSWSRMMF